MSPTKVHLDTDIGGDLDDACALALLLSLPEVEITGVTTVVENDGRRAGYARYLLDLAGRTGVPVAAGAEASHPRFRAPYGLPPEERYWPVPVPPLPAPIDAALNLIARSVEQGATMVGIGPFTNLALAEQRRPGLLAGATLCLMGGSVRPIPDGFPAWDFTMDFNIQADVQSAYEVLAACEPSRTVLVPLEVTAQTWLRRADLPGLRSAGPLARLIADQAAAFAEDQRLDAQFGRACAGLPDDLVNFQHDPLACAVALGWDGVTVETVPLTPALTPAEEGGTEDGWLRVRADPGGRPFRVVTAVDASRFADYWLGVLTSDGSAAR
jgi:inosine-uridine nucleoside N-ribohydrolase